jgi:hypothetical protein
MESEALKWKQEEITFTDKARATSHSALSHVTFHLIRR